MTSKKQIGFFEKYLKLWVGLCIGTGILIGNVAGEGVAIALFGLQSPAALVTVVGVLVEVPVMLSLVALSNKWRY